MARNQNPVPPAAAPTPQGSQSQESAEQKAAREAAEAQARADAEAAEKAKAEPVVVSLRHTTPHAVYRRAGIVIGKVAAEFSVTAEQLAVLKADPWVEVVTK
jgi:hypothetical protein